MLTWNSHGDPVSELVGTILSQHTSDVNTARSYASLRTSFPTWEALELAGVEHVAAAIASGGLANIKAPRIQAVLTSIRRQHGSIALDHLATSSVADARRELEALPGVGPKTASCVLLFSLGKPAMPVDTHVHRVARRTGLVPDRASAEATQFALEAMLPASRDDLYDFHVHAIRLGRRVCTARQPFCNRCPLAERCLTARTKRETDDRRH